MFILYLSNETLTLNIVTLPYGIIYKATVREEWNKTKKKKNYLIQLQQISQVEIKYFSLYYRKKYSREINMATIHRTLMTIKWNSLAPP